MKKKFSVLIIFLGLVCNFSGCNNTVSTDNSNNSEISSSQGTENSSKIENNKDIIDLNKLHYSDNDKKIENVKKQMSNFFSYLNDEEMQKFEKEYKLHYNVEFDKNDNDSDGICNGYEVMIGTDKNKADTDGDGIDDLVEMAFGLDPTKENKDTDNDGINDIDEIRIGTNPIKKDTDYDGLNDYEEIYTYQTNPTEKDTDGDNLTDYEEIKLKLNPLNKDTDNNGITDDKEKIKQIYTIDINKEDSNDGKVLQATIAGNISGYIETSCTLKNTYNIDVFSSRVVSLVGVPVKVEINTEYDNVKVSFKVDTKNMSEKYFNKLGFLYQKDDGRDDQWYYIQKTEYDFKNSTLTTDFVGEGTYLLVDLEDWNNVWSNNNSVSFS